MAVSDLWFDKAEGSVLLSCWYQYEQQQVWTSLYRLLAHSTESALSARESYREVELPSLPFPTSTFSRVVTSLCLFGQSFVWPSPLLQPWIWLISCHPCLLSICDLSVIPSFNTWVAMIREPAWIFYSSTVLWSDGMSSVQGYSFLQGQKFQKMYTWVCDCPPTPAPLLFSSHENMWE